MSLYIGILSSYPATASLLLNLYPSAAAAYSLRKLRSGYGSSAIRVRRDLDNAEQDIGFVNNQLDTASLLAFTGSENYVYWSQDFTQSIWTKTNTTITTSAGTAPDGTNTANNCVIAANSNVKAIYQSLPSVSTRNYVFSVYAKANQYSYVQLMAIRDSTNRYSIIVDLTTGLITQSNSVGTPNFVSSSVTSVGNGWYRIVITLNINLGTNYMVFSPSPVANPTLNASLDLTSAGDGTSGVLLWGAQLNYVELKPYQVTTTAQKIFASAFVTTWYDQSGNSVNATQTTASNQPRIVAGGAIETQLSKPTIKLTNSAGNGFTTSLTLNNPFSIISVVSQDLSPTLANFRLFQSSTNNSIIVIKRVDNLSVYTGTTVLANFPSQVSNQPYIISFLRQSTTSYIYQNNTPVTNSSTSSANWGTFTINGQGSFASEAVLGRLSELIIYSTNQNANISGINSNINSYYTIY